MTTPVRPAERYGDIRPAWHYQLARVLVVTLAVLGLAWVAYAGLQSANQPVRWSDIGYKIVSPEQAEVTFDVTVYDGTTATCSVQALTADYSVVGHRDVTVDVGSRPNHSVRERVTITTQQEAVTAIVDGCRVP